VGTLNACPNDPPGEVLIEVPAPEGWTGECYLLENPIPENTFASIKYYPPEVSPCTPITGMEPMSTAATWKMIARACVAGDAGPQPEEPPPGFSQCVFLEGEASACPAGYPEQWTFYGGFEADLGCTPCTCDPPEGSDCMVKFSSYSVPNCDGGINGGWVWLGDGGCITTSDGFMKSGIASMDATMEIDLPGSCAPAGGQPIGQSAPTTPRTFCCTSSN
jgi:hypothetical protein